MSYLAKLMEEQDKTEELVIRLKETGLPEI